VGRERGAWAGGGLRRGGQVYLLLRRRRLMRVVLTMVARPDPTRLFSMMLMGTDSCG
jgi:hypothetical protein